jgi:hypothetical protein
MAEKTSGCEDKNTQELRTYYCRFLYGPNASGTEPLLSDDEMKSVVENFYRGTKRISELRVDNIFKVKASEWFGLEEKEKNNK